MSLHDLIELLEAAGVPHDQAFQMAFHHVYNRRKGERRQGERREDA